MKCHDIHDNACLTELASDWKFCPTCGRKPASVTIETPSLLFPFRQPLALRHRGFESVTFAAKVDAATAPEAAPLRITGAPISIRAGQMAGLRFEWTSQIPPPDQPPLRVPLRILTDDGPPRDPWSDDAIQTRRREWQVLLNIAAATKARLQLLQDVAIFHPACNQRTVQIANTGDEILQLNPIEPPYGYAIESDDKGPRGADAWTIAPRSMRQWKLRALGAAPVGESTLTVWSRDLKQKAALRLLHQNREKIEATTTRVVGVDFGTSGTSVWMRSGKDAREAAFALKDPAARRDEDPLRFPTEIFIRMKGGVEEKHGFTIGYEARQASEAQGGRGLFVRELKSLLRGDEEPFVAEFGPQYTIDNLLRRYLQTLKEKIIDPALGAPGATIAWNFSVPVLDGHRGGARVLFERQKSRLEKAVRAANFVTTGCTLEFFTEPYCAAVYLLLQHGQYRFPAGQSPKDGDWACVFDSGGGTTDVVLGRLYHQHGRLQFEEVSTLGGYRSDDKAQEVNTFGGQALTRRTALYLTVRHDYLKLFDGGNSLSAQVVSAMQSAAIEGGEKAVASDENWQGSAPLWFREIESYKKQIARLPAPNSEGQIDIANRQTGGQKVKIRRAQFDKQVVDIRLEPLQKEMDRSVFAIDKDTERGDLPLPSQVRWVFGVGGNCRVRRIGDDWLHGYFTAGVQNLESLNSQGEMDDSDRMLAVSGGTVWAAQARRANAAPYRIWVAESAGEKGAPQGLPVFELFANDALSDQTVYPECNRLVPPGEEARFEVWIEGNVAAGEVNVPFRGCVGSFALRNDDFSQPEKRNLSAYFRFQGRKLLVEADENGASRVAKFEYVV